MTKDFELLEKKVYNLQIAFLLWVVIGGVLIWSVNNLIVKVMPSLDGYHEVCECVKYEEVIYSDWALDHCREFPDAHIGDMKSYIYTRYGCGESNKTPAMSYLCENLGVKIDYNGDGVVRASTVDTHNGYDFAIGYVDYDTITNMCGRLYRMNKEIYTNVTKECVKNECRLVKEGKI
jgi:hypothetical protein